MIQLPISFNARSTSAALREVLKELKFKFERETTQKHYTRMMVVMPMPKFAYAFRFVVKEPSEFVMDLYDAKMTHSGVMHFIEIDGVNKENANDIRKVLNGLVKKLPRKPWKFTLGQRFQYAFLAPEIVTAKRKWRKLGIE
ncbi:hypothetical protein FP804_03210 [archaeon]|nr:hypothetical protein [archaeon]